MCCGITLTNARGQKKEEETKRRKYITKVKNLQRKIDSIAQKSQKEFQLEYNNNINYNFSDF